LIQRTNRAFRRAFLPNGEAARLESIDTLRIDVLSRRASCAWLGRIDRKDEA